MRQKIDNIPYDTETAVLISHNKRILESGHEWLTHMYRTEEGNYFLHHSAPTMSEYGRIEPLSEECAISVYEEMPECDMEHADAFRTENE
ncbi:hypothetical protein [uncultured Methanolobus sp.]|uniref:hypothetical protein n=1 Tax=uncultured Methanolobus sp. TaxID=218300 RepID=UPI002AAB1108|nr:hypothetical protein [uncultured Methanolobus sp.]